MKQYNQPATEVFDLKSDALMQGLGLVMSPNPGGGGGGKTEAPARRGTLIPD